MIERNKHDFVTKYPHSFHVIYCNLMTFTQHIFHLTNMKFKSPTLAYTLGINNKARRVARLIYQHQYTKG